jgi:glutaminyl-peptide cyclotransferase
VYVCKTRALYTARHLLLIPRLYAVPFRNKPHVIPRYRQNTMQLLRSLLILPLALREALAYTTLADESLQSLSIASDDFSITNDDGLLAPILIPRVPGTPGNAKVLQHFHDFFTNNLPEWKLSFQNSSSVTPTSKGKEVPFRNFIATRDPPWVEGEGEVSRLALVAHFDSKLTPKNFIGATDSAAPCAMLLHAARGIDAALTAKWAAVEAKGERDEFEEDKGVQILLLDGEEAFATWTHTDSVYGARALAEEWESTMNPAMSTFKNPLESIDLFVLLDLLGASNPAVPSYFKTTHWAYKRMASVEERLRKADKLKSKPKGNFLWESDKDERDRWSGGMVEDDHIPFMARGVDILHIIPSPFPDVWHTSRDDGKHLDLDVVEDWAMITTAFAAEWMELEGFMQNNKEPRKGSKGKLYEHDRTEL